MTDKKQYTVEDLNAEQDTNQYQQVNKLNFDQNMEKPNYYVADATSGTQTPNDGTRSSYMGKNINDTRGSSMGLGSTHTESIGAPAFGRTASDILQDAKQGNDDRDFTFMNAAKVNEEKAKLRMVYSIFASMLVCGTLYLNISSFYPLYVSVTYGDQISTVLIACTLCCFNLAGVVCTPIHAITIGKMGRKNALLVGFWAILISNTALGLCASISAEQPTLFIALCCIARFVQGYGDSLAMATSMSLISSNFPQEKEKYISYIGASMGVGLMLGPPLGSVIYGATGFACVFYFFSVWIFIMILLQMAFIPSSYNYDRESTMLPAKDGDINKNLIDTEISQKSGRTLSIRSLSSNKVASRSSSFAMARNKMMELHESKKEQRMLSLLDLEAVDLQVEEHSKEDMIKGYMLIGVNDVTIMSTLKDKSVVFAFLANAVAMFNISFFSSFLAIRFHDKYDISDGDMGYYFAILSVAYLSSAILCPIIFRALPRKLQFVTCFAVSTIALGLFGPSELIGLPEDKFALVLTGMPILAFIQALCFIPSLPEAIECFQVRHRLVPDIEPALDGKLNDIMSSGYGFFYNLASMLGPIVGSVLYDTYGFRGVMDQVMIFEGCVTLIFLIFNCGPNVFKNDAFHKREMTKMKKVSEIILKIAEREKLEQEGGMLSYLNKELAEQGIKQIPS